MTEDEIRKFDESLPVRLPEVIIDVAFWSVRLDAYLDRFDLDDRSPLGRLVMAARDHLARCEGELTLLLPRFTHEQEQVHGPYEDPMDAP